jgi:hypothetical protein
VRIAIFDAHTGKVYGVMSDDSGEITFDPPDTEFPKMLNRPRRRGVDPMEFYKAWSNGYTATRQIASDEPVPSVISW